MTDTPKSGGACEICEKTMFIGKCPHNRFRLEDVVVIKTPNDCKWCERRVNSYVKSVKEWQRSYDQALKRIEKLREALKVYATSEYVDVKQRGRGIDCDGLEYEDLIIDDNGEIARQALAADEGKK